MGQAIIESCRVRLRPILMTSLATVIGLLPMAMKLGEGSESYAPLARALVGGLIVSTALTVFLVPAGFFLVYGRNRKAGVISGAESLVSIHSCGWRTAVLRDHAISMKELAWSSRPERSVVEGPAVHPPQPRIEWFYSFLYPFQTEVSSRPERSEVEGPAVHHPHHPI